MTEESVKRLYRSPHDRMIGGVCGGVAEYFSVDSVVVRIIWALSVLAGGLGLWMYLAAWAIVPERPAAAEEVGAKKASHTGVVWGVVLIVIGLFLLGRRFDLFFPGFYYPHWRMYRGWSFDAWGLHSGLWLPLLIIIAGVVYLIYILTRQEAPKQEQASAAGGSEAEAPAPEKKKRLFRIKEGRMIAGVCQGLAEHFNLDVSLVRLLWVLATLLTSVILGVVAYFAMAIIVPERTTAEAA